MVGIDKMRKVQVPVCRNFAQLKLDLAEMTTCWGANEREIENLRRDSVDM